MNIPPIHTWEYIPGYWSDREGKLPSVRRIRVDNGWLYQIDNIDNWTQPVFVHD